MVKYQDTAYHPGSLTELQSHTFDAIIDVRTPMEYAIDHISGAVNLPVLSNEQRAHVGTIYKQDSSFKAHRIGAAIISRNIANILDNQLADKSKKFSPLIYCWRGGKRSGALSEVCRQVGWNSATLGGGYTSYRRLVNDLLYKQELPFRLVLLCGDTGSAKTEILGKLAESGCQILDLENLANHRGSIFGAHAEGQPSQKRFESRLADTLSQFDSSFPVISEAESCRIGSITLPPSLWKTMQSSPRIRINVSRDARVCYILSQYDHLYTGKHQLNSSINKLSKFHARELIAHWQQLAQIGAWQPLVEGLIKEHYDPLYKRYSSTNALQLATSFNLQSLTSHSIEHATYSISNWINRNIH